MAVSLFLNGKHVALEVEPDLPLLWAIREAAGLTGTKYGCGMAMCGACTVHLEGRAIRSCVTPLRSVVDKPITTIEGISGPLAQAVLQSWEKLEVPQCGYCQPGQIMSALALLSQTPVPTDDQIDTAMSGNICCCGTYVRIRALHMTLRIGSAESSRLSPAERSPHLPISAHKSIHLLPTVLCGTICFI